MDKIKRIKYPEIAMEKIDPMLIAILAVKLNEVISTLNEIIDDKKTGR